MYSHEAAFFVREVKLLRRIGIASLAVLLCLLMVPRLMGAGMRTSGVSEAKIADLLQRMTLDEKVGLLSGASEMKTRAVPRLGIPALEMTDGPHGIRKGKATCFPTAITLASTWNPKLVERVGNALADEARAKGCDVLLGPCVNIQRTPLGGRVFESFSEDPYLAASLTAAYVRGVQQHGVAACVKHFACNNQEWDRGSIDVRVSERAMREIYFPAFHSAVRAGVWAVMAAYNRVNGSYCCANRHLLTDVLRHDWGFRGIVLSDWWACHSTVASALAGLDLEMPGPGQYFSKKLLLAVKRGEVPEDVIDEKVARLLRLILWRKSIGLWNVDRDSFLGMLSEHRSLSREVASQGVVLLKNDRDFLPLKISSSGAVVAVLGPNAACMRAGGGGSSRVYSYYFVTPLQAIAERCLQRNVEVLYGRGCGLGDGELTPIPSIYLKPDDNSASGWGLRGEYYDNPDLSGTAAVSRIDPLIFFDWGDLAPARGLPADEFSVRWHGRLSVPRDGRYRIGMISDDGVRLYLDGRLLIDHWKDHAPDCRTATVTLVSGRSYPIKVEYHERRGVAVAKLVWDVPGDDIEAAEHLAEESDAALIFVGLSSRFEGEGHDRSDIELPGRQAELIERVARINTNTVVILVNGSPISMESWIESVPAVLEAWYPGQEGGDAIADILFGVRGPEGRLPITIPRRLEDSAEYGNYPGAGGHVDYAEDLFVGYRHYDMHGIAPRYPFGHGLSYTRFKYSELKLQPSSKRRDELDVSIVVRNCGKYTGVEVVQVYVHDCDPVLKRPINELKAFKRVALKPGESRPVLFHLNKDAFCYFDPAHGRWRMPRGKVDILIGSSSRDIRLRGEVTIGADAAIFLSARDPRQRCSRMGGMPSVILCLGRRASH